MLVPTLLRRSHTFGYTGTMPRSVIAPALGLKEPACIAHSARGRCWESDSRGRHPRDRTARTAIRSVVLTLVCA